MRRSKDSESAAVVAQNVDAGLIMFPLLSPIRSALEFQGKIAGYSRKNADPDRNKEAYKPFSSVTLKIR